MSYTIKEQLGALREVMKSTSDFTLKNKLNDLFSTASAAKIIFEDEPDLLDKIQEINKELLNALRIAHPILLEACDKWSNGEDWYDSAMVICELAIKKATR